MRKPRLVVSCVGSSITLTLFYFMLLVTLLSWHNTAAVSSVARHQVAEETFVPHSSLYQDPVDFFLGSKKRPRLEIVSPKQGAVLDNGILDIEIRIHYPKEISQGALSADGTLIASDKNEQPPQTPLHGSALCLSVATSRGDESEDCFLPTERMFHAGGLIAGQAYTIKFTLFERNQAIAATLRTVRVAGIRAAPYVREIMTIHSALQVAAQYALRGMENAAEEIYKSILAEAPLNPQALHNIGAMYYHKGDSVKATEFVERALQHRGNYSLTGYHNTLGICYKTLGRLDEAERQFRVAIEVDPTMVGAKYNLGLLLQSQKRWTEAIELYQVVMQQNPLENDKLPEEYIMDSAVRACDLLQAQQRYDDAIKCWQHGIQKYPHHYIFYEELGSALAQLRMYDTARYYMEKALVLGHLPAEEKLAQILEAMGAYEEAKHALEHCITRARENTPVPERHSHLLIRNVTMLPKVISSREDIRGIRQEQLQHLEALLVLDEQFEVDNASPHNLGFGLGFEYLYHDEGSNVRWKQHLQRLYLRYCPALAQGFFLVHPEQRYEQRQENNANVSDASGLLSTLTLSSNTSVTVKESFSNTVVKNNTANEDSHNSNVAQDVQTTLRQRHDCRRRVLAAAALLTATETSIDTNIEIFDKSSDNSSIINTADNAEIAPEQSNIDIPPIVASEDSEELKNSSKRTDPSDFADELASSSTSDVYCDENEDQQDLADIDESKANAISPLVQNQEENSAHPLSAPTSPWLLSSSRPFPDRPARIVFVSRFFFHHQCGLLSAGLIELLAGKISLSLDHLHQQYQPLSITTSAEYFAKLYEVHVVFLEGGTNTSVYHDHLQARLLRIAAPHVHSLRFLDNVQQITSYLRELSPDVLIYPEIGLDALTYFTGYARLAPVQAAWLGHPDTSGLDTIDYFLTTKVQTSVSPAPLLSSSNSGTGESITTTKKVKANSHTTNHLESPFTEQEYAFTHFGTIFLDLYESRANVQRTSPRTIQLNRAKYLEQHHWPKNAHMYVIPYPPAKLHPDFDQVIIQLLLRDKLALIVIAELGRASLSLQNIFIARLRDKLSTTNMVPSPLTRLLFPEMHSPLEMTALIQMADVMLEPFPMTGSFEVSLSALSMGVPVITLPHTSHIAGRMCLALYEMLDYGIVGSNAATHNNVLNTTSNNTTTVDNAHSSVESSTNCTNNTTDNLSTPSPSSSSLYTRLVVDSVSEYFETAMKLAHHPKLREYHTQQLLQRREKFFRVNVWRLAEEWKRFVFGALHNQTIHQHNSNSDRHRSDSHKL